MVCLVIDLRWHCSSRCQQRLLYHLHITAATGRFTTAVIEIVSLVVMVVLGLTVVLLIVLEPVMVVGRLVLVQKLVCCFWCLVLYLLGLGLLKGELQGGHGQLVGKEVNVPGQLERADRRRRAVPSSDTAEQLPLPERGREMWGRDQGEEEGTRYRAKDVPGKCGWSLKVCLFSIFPNPDPVATVALWLKAKGNWSIRYKSPGFNMAAPFISRELVAQ